MKNIHLQNASAGSGKTYTLAEDVMNKVLAGVEPEQLIVTTFTKKAAAELRERLRRQLINGEKIQEAHRVKDGHIGTVNSVSARIMKEYAIDSGASPALDVLPEEDEARIFRVAISEAISTHSVKIEEIVERCDRTEEYSMFGDPRNWENDVKEIVTLARSNRISGPEVRAFAAKSWDSVKVLFAEGENGRDDLEKLLTALEKAFEELDGKDLVAQTAKDEFKFIRQAVKEIQRNGFLRWSQWAKVKETKFAKETRDEMAAAQEIAGHLLAQKLLYTDMKALVDVVFDCAADALEQYTYYKEQNGLMDFADQDAGVLDLLDRNKDVARQFSERVEEVFVDEFQDTNPIQLALFIELSKLSRRSLWVGDPKQAIYGFRGTDSRLMEAATRAIPPGNIEKSLDRSYRSKERLIDFTNAIFSKVFHKMKETDVCLDVPEGWEEKARGGCIETWNIPGNKQLYNRGIAGGVKELLDRRQEYKCGDVAVLCRSNISCELVAKSLEDMGIRATAEQGNIMNTPECRLAIAALKYMNDNYDTLALTEVVSLSPFHAAHKGWLADILKKSKDPEKYGDRFEEWITDPLIQALEAQRDNIRHFDVMEALEAAINTVRLVETAAIWTKPEQRFGNLDRLRAACSEYLEYCRVQRSAGTVAGFVIHLSENETKQAQGVGEDAVQVMTYHKAKGLQWPVVVLADMASEIKFSAFGVVVEADTKFDATRPLDGRYIRYWPWPFGGKKGVIGLDTITESTDEYKNAKELAEEEAKRLMYVGMTRAESGIVLVPKLVENQKSTRLETKWLDILVGKDGAKVVNLPMEPGDRDLKIGDKEIPVTTKIHRPETFSNATEWRTSKCFVAPLAEAREYPVAKFAASKVEDEVMVKAANVTQARVLKTRLMVNGRFESEIVGDAVHAYLGVNTRGRTINEKVEIARRCLANFGLELNIKLDGLVAIGNQMEEFIDEAYPGAEIMCEWPVTYQNELGQYMEGPIDMLLETPDGYVIIDHKTYSGSSPEKHAKKYAPQLNAYKAAVEAATGKKVLATLVHMPVVGAIYEVK